MIYIEIHILSPFNIGLACADITLFAHSFFAILDGGGGTAVYTGHAVGAFFAPDRSAVHQSDTLVGTDFGAFAAAHTAVGHTELLRGNESTVEPRIYQGGKGFEHLHIKGICQLFVPVDDICDADYLAVGAAEYLFLLFL